MKKYNPLHLGSVDSFSAGEKKIQNATHTWWFNKIVLPVLTVAFSSLDAVTLYPLFDALFTSSPLLKYMTTFGTALCLNFVPLIAARLYLRYKYRMGEKNLVLFYLSLTVFAVLYIAICILRFATRDIAFSSMADYISSELNANLGAEHAPGRIPMVIVQCATNFVTSAIAYYLSYLSENPLVMTINKLKLEIINLKEYVTTVTCAIEELEGYDYEAEIEREERMYEIAVAELENRRDSLKVLSDLQLEIFRHDPEDTSFVTDACAAKV